VPQVSGGPPLRDDARRLDRARRHRGLDQQVGGAHGQGRGGRDGRRARARRADAHRGRGAHAHGARDRQRGGDGGRQGAVCAQDERDPQPHARGARRAALRPAPLRLDQGDAREHLCAAAPGGGVEAHGAAHCQGRVARAARGVPRGARAHHDGDPRGEPERRRAQQGGGGGARDPAGQRACEGDGELVAAGAPLGAGAARQGPRKQGALRGAGGRVR
jgi:hypothetical protein